MVEGNLVIASNFRLRSIAVLTGLEHVGGDLIVSSESAELIDEARRLSQQVSVGGEVRIEAL